MPIYNDLKVEFNTYSKKSKKFYSTKSQSFE